MKAAEILRSLIDIIAQEEEKESNSQPVVININNGQPEEAKSVEKPVDDDVGTFVPPLQQNIELMKKDQGVMSIYDEPEEELSSEETDSEDQECDELTNIKRIAGIRPINVANSSRGFRKGFEG